MEELYGFYIKRIERRDNVWDFSSESRNLQNYYSPSNKIANYKAKLYYKSASGIGSYGKPQAYTETYAESEVASVVLADEDAAVSSRPREQTDVTLSFYILYEGEEQSLQEKIKAIWALYYDFVDFVSDGFLMYYDNLRQRKMLCYQSEKIELKEDSVKNDPLLLVEIKFKNMFGRTFPISEYSPIEKLIGAKINLTKDV